jgi:hypothetical protein
MGSAAAPGDQLEGQNATADKGMGNPEEPEDDRERKLALRQRDKDFLTETEKIKTRLIELKKTNPNLFRSLFRDGGYLAAFRPDMLASWASDAKNEDERQILRDFWFYTVRFQVWLRPNAKGDGFKKPLARPPYKTKFRARLVDGRCQAMSDDGARTRGPDDFRGPL